MSLGFQLTHDSISPALSHLAGSDMENRMVLGAATALAALAQRAFDEPGLRPSAWAPRKASSKGDHPLLLLSGTLRQSIHPGQAGGGQCEIRIPPVYAAHQQLGSDKTSGRGSGVPARPFFPALNGEITPRGYEDIDAVMEALVGSGT
jgi:phage gpG-like protein